MEPPSADKTVDVTTETGPKAERCVKILMYNINYVKYVRTLIPYNLYTTYTNTLYFVHSVQVYKNQSAKIGTNFTR